MTTIQKQMNNVGSTYNDPRKSAVRQEQSTEVSSETKSASTSNQKVKQDLFSGVSVNLNEKLNSLPVINEAKVAEIKDKIKRGEFKVNAEAIADGLIKNAKELLGGSVKEKI